MSETTKTTGVQDEAEKEVLETEEPVTEPVEESPEATAGENPEGEKEAEATDEKEAKGKTSFFGKKKKDNKLEQQIEDLTDRLKRNMAEFDNFRKRTEKEKTQMFETGAKSIVEKILPVVDNFERGLDALSEEEKEGAFAQGFIKIYQQMITVLEEIGVKPMDAVGKEFNPDFHNAVMHEENEEMGENLVSEEFQKGYMYKDGVLRHSMVKVVN